MLHLKIKNKTVCVFSCGEADRPVIYLNTFGNEGAQVYDALQKAGSPKFNLVAVSGLDWNHDMAPWDCPPVTKNGDPFTAGADDCLKILTDDIIPAAEAEIDGTPAYRGIAGYSLAGLFAVYALYKTDMFSAAAGVSGSFWFPGFKEFAANHKMKCKPEYLYFSLGDREYKTRNVLMKTVQIDTEELAAFYKAQGIDTEFFLNPGNHFQNSVSRTASAIKSVLAHLPD